jgi:hypothetical protein
MGKHMKLTEQERATIIDALTVAACQYVKDADQAADLALQSKRCCAKTPSRLRARVRACPTGPRAVCLNAWSRSAACANSPVVRPSASTGSSDGETDGDSISKRI